MTDTLRMILAEKCLSIAALLAPKTDDGTLLLKHIAAYFSEFNQEKQ